MSNLVAYNEMQQMAEAMARSQLFGMKTPDQVVALMLVAQANGQHPAAAARDYDIISGRPSKKAEAMLRDFIAAGGSVQWHRLDNECADATFSHPAGGSIRIDWDMRRAKDAGLGGKDMYRKFPRQMLRSRCISEGVRTVYPVATGGMYAPEEVQDMGPRQERDMGAADVVEPEMPAGLLEAAQTAAMDGIEAFRAYWRSASPEARTALCEHIPALKVAAEAADAPTDMIEAE
jgi:hypothetical protein